MININNLNFFYQDKQVFNNLSLNLSSPGKYLILGENGTGKSTFLNLLTGILFFSHGQILIDKIPVKNKYNFIRSLINYVPENIDLNLNYNLSTILKLYNLDLHKDLELLNLKSAYRYNCLSQGYKFRFVIYLAIKKFKKYLFIDDLLKYQDESNSLINFFINNFNGRTIIVTSPKEIKNISWDNVFEIKDGKIINV